MIRINSVKSKQEINRNNVGKILGLNARPEQPEKQEMERERERERENEREGDRERE